jgi:hypothetical protein
VEQLQPTSGGFGGFKSSKAFDGFVDWPVPDPSPDCALPGFAGRCSRGRPSLPRPGSLGVLGPTSHSITS